MSVLTEIAEGLAAITPEQVARTGMQFLPLEKDKKVEGIVPEHAQRLWALVWEYRRQHELNGHAATFDANTVAEKDTLIAAAQRWKHLADTVKTMAWIETHDAIGESSWLANNTSLRAGFLVVDEEEEEQIDLLPLGSLPLSAGAAQIFKRAIKRILQAREAREESDPEEEPKKDKFQ